MTLTMSSNKSGLSALEVQRVVLCLLISTNYIIYIIIKGEDGMAVRRGGGGHFKNIKILSHFLNSFNLLPNKQSVKQGIPILDTTILTLINLLALYNWAGNNFCKTLHYLL